MAAGPIDSLPGLDAIGAVDRRRLFRTDGDKPVGEPPRTTALVFSTVSFALRLALFD
jgi:hypothetical protein